MSGRQGLVVYGGLSWLHCEREAMSGDDEECEWAGRGCSFDFGLGVGGRSGLRREREGKWAAQAAVQVQLVWCIVAAALQVRGRRRRASRHAQWHCKGGRAVLLCFAAFACSPCCQPTSGMFSHPWAPSCTCCAFQPPMQTASCLAAATRRMSRRRGRWSDASGSTLAWRPAQLPLNVCEDLA